MKRKPSATALAARIEEIKTCIALVDGVAGVKFREADILGLPSRIKTSLRNRQSTLEAQWRREFGDLSGVSSRSSVARHGETQETEAAPHDEIGAQDQPQGQGASAPRRGTD